MTCVIPFQVAFLTGQSDSRRWALSPEQAHFLQALALPAQAAVPMNFPYRADTLPHRRVPLWQASLNNGRMYLRSRKPAFRAEYLSDITKFLARAELTVFIAGSCGLELLSNLALYEEQLQRIRAIGLGPVSRGLPQCETMLIQGRQDWLSRFYFADVDYRVACGHMGYLRSEKVLSLCRGYIAGVLDGKKTHSPRMQKMHAAHGHEKGT